MLRHKTLLFWGIHSTHLHISRVTSCTQFKPQKLNYLRSEYSNMWGTTYHYWRTPTKPWRNRGYRRACVTSSVSHKTVPMFVGMWCWFWFMMSAVDGSGGGGVSRRGGCRPECSRVLLLLLIFCCCEYAAPSCNTMVIRALFPSEVEDHLKNVLSKKPKCMQSRNVLNIGLFGSSDVSLWIYFYTHYRMKLIVFIYIYYAHTPILTYNTMFNSIYITEIELLF